MGMSRKARAKQPRDGLSERLERITNASAAGRCVLPDVRVNGSRHDQSGCGVLEEVVGTAAAELMRNLQQPVRLRFAWQSSVLLRQPSHEHDIRHPELLTHFTLPEIVGTSYPRAYGQEVVW